MDETTAREQTDPFLAPDWYLPEVQEPRRGDLCPACGEGVLDYDGMLNLGCPECGFSLSGCFT